MEYLSRKELFQGIVKELAEADLLNVHDYCIDSAREESELIIAHALEDYQLIKGDIL